MSYYSEQSAKVFKNSPWLVSKIFLPYVLQYGSRLQTFPKGISGICFKNVYGKNAITSLWTGTLHTIKKYWYKCGVWKQFILHNQHSYICFSFWNHSFPDFKWWSGNYSRDLNMSTLKKQSKVRFIQQSCIADESSFHPYFQLIVFIKDTLEAKDTVS